MEKCVLKLFVSALVLVVFSVTSITAHQLPVIAGPFDSECGGLEGGFGYAEWSGSASTGNTTCVLCQRTIVFDNRLTTFTSYGVTNECIMAPMSSTCPGRAGNCFPW